MSELKKGEQREVWVKALHINDAMGSPVDRVPPYGVEKIILLAPDGEEMWDWLIFADAVEHVPRESNRLEDSG